MVTSLSETDLAYPAFWGDWHNLPFWNGKPRVY